MAEIHRIVTSIAAAAVFTTLVEVIAGENNSIAGFRTVCGLSVILSVMQAVCAAINL